jgi:hypothetical protein
MLEILQVSLNILTLLEKRLLQSLKTRINSPISGVPNFVSIDGE